MAEEAFLPEGAAVVGGEFLEDGVLGGAEVIDEGGIVVEDALDFVACFVGGVAGAGLIGSAEGFEEAAFHVDDGHAIDHSFDGVVMEVSGFAAVVVHDAGIAVEGFVLLGVEEAEDVGVIDGFGLCSGDEVWEVAEVAFEVFVDTAVVVGVAGDARADEEEAGVGAGPGILAVVEAVGEAEWEYDGAISDEGIFDKRDGVVAGSEPESVLDGLDAFEDVVTGVVAEEFGVVVGCFSAEGAEEESALVVLDEL